MEVAVSLRGEVYAAESFVRGAIPAAHVVRQTHTLLNDYRAYRLLVLLEIFRKVVQKAGNLVA